MFTPLVMRMSLLKNLAKESGVDRNIRFIGWIDDVNEIFSMIDLFVLPSLSESLPVSIIEAMSFGIPVVATDVGGVPEIVADGETGYIISSTDRECGRTRIHRVNVGLVDLKCQ